MEKYKSERIQKKSKIKVAHDACGEMKFDYALFPIGFKYNENLQALRQGDTIVLLDKSERYVLNAMKLPLNSAIAEYLCWMRYGFGIARAVEVWKERLRVNKLDVKMMSEDECLIVFFEKGGIGYEQSEECIRNA